VVNPYAPATDAKEQRVLSAWAETDPASSNPATNRAKSVVIAFLYFIIPPG
jgi:hypothetical protein